MQRKHGECRSTLAAVFWWNFSVHYFMVMEIYTFKICKHYQMQKRQTSVKYSQSKVIKHMRASHQQQQQWQRQSRQRYQQQTTTTKNLGIPDEGQSISQVIRDLVLCRTALFTTALWGLSKS